MSLCGEIDVVYNTQFNRSVVNIVFYTTKQTVNHPEIFIKSVATNHLLVTLFSCCAFETFLTNHVRIRFLSLDYSDPFPDFIEHNVQKAVFSVVLSWLSACAVVRWAGNERV